MSFSLNSLRIVLAACVFVLLSLASEFCLAVDLKVATFKVDVTPPIGSPLCFGAVPPMSGINDPLTARGIILQADDQKPVVLVAVDWVGIGNEGHDAWREAIAQACHTSIDRVSVHCLHPHDAPGCDFLEDRISATVGLNGQTFPVEFAREAIDRVAAAAAVAQTKLEPVTEVGYGQGIVEKVASNRRVLQADGKVHATRFTACKDPELIAAPEGTIDPNVRLVSFWNGDRSLAVLSYYATHPQSYYYTGKVSVDFPGMAREEREAAERTDLHIHFNGAGGNIGAGKYNDGSHANRPVLAGRLAEGMKRAWEATKKTPVKDLSFDWSTQYVSLPLANWLDEADLRKTLNDESQPSNRRIQAASELAYAQRVKEGDEICIGRLRLGPIDIIHMPGELFVEYQLAAQKLRPDAFVCMAAYGDCGPGYIGTAVAYTQGGYETGADSRASLVSPRAEAILTEAMQKLLQ